MSSTLERGSIVPNGQEESLLPAGEARETGRDGRGYGAALALVILVFEVAWIGSICYLAVRFAHLI